MIGLEYYWHLTIIKFGDSILLAYANNILGGKNNIIDINSKDINIDCLELNNKVEIENNLDIYDLNVMFIGLCSDCKEELKWQDRQKLEK